jgi:DNA-binding transcriptional LysR family regulator
MSPDLRWLRSFLAVAAERHFSRAARKLNLAQPALTAHIRQLEEAVGARLLERSNRTGGLTPAGRGLLPEAEAIVARADGLRRKVREIAHGEAGRLRLGLIPPAVTADAAAALRLLALELPGIEVQVRQGDQHALENLVLDGDLDLALTRPPEKVALARRRLFVERQGVLLRAGDPLARRRSVSLRELAGRRLLLLRDNPHFGGNLVELARERGVALEATRSAEDFPSLHWLVLAGMGVAPCSLLLADTLPAGLVAKPLQPSPPRLEIHAIWRGKTPTFPAERWLRLLSAPAS